MLPAAHRLRCSSDFDRVVRKGVRLGRRNLVLHLRCGQSESSRRVGFVVSKAVGNAVKRNLVKRRLRAIMAREVASLAPGTDVVVRALPAASRARFWELERDVQGGLRKYQSPKVAQRSVK